MKKIEYCSAWKERRKEEKRRRILAIERAKQIAKVLKDKYYVRETILFGSLISRSNFLSPRTDIDLMVKGLDGKKYFEVLADVSRLAYPFQIDLIPFEKAESLIKKRALREGLRLE